MKDSLRAAVDLFVENKEVVEKAFRWDESYMHPLSGLMYSSEGKNIDVERMKEAQSILKKETSVLSEFRSNVFMAIITQMSLSEDMKGYFDKVQNLYKLLNNKKIFGSEYRIIAAMVIAKNFDDASMTEEQCVEKTYEIYRRMKENHPWLTDDEDMGFAALLAMSGLDSDPVEEEMEACYQLLKESKRFPSANGIQSLSHILSLELGNSAEKCDRVIVIYDGLKAAKKKYGSEYELSTLGCLALLGIDTDIIVNEIIEVDDYLKAKKGFGALGIGSEQRMMYAAMLVMQQYAPKDMQVEATALSGVVSTIIAQQVAIMTAISISVAVSSLNHV